ncbi:MAG: hypothetical protein KDK30_17935, partial [Leptospiraceae bacterium]|nr:hypothetical protein [Leptospiraceae bacterium]
EPLNSMQKMTALFAVSVYRSIRKLQLPPGLYFAEELGRDARIVQTVLSELRAGEIRLERVEL